MKRSSRFLFKVFIVLALGLVSASLIVALDRVFVLISPPEIVALSPEKGADNVSLSSPLVIKFDKPLKRQEVQLSISPEVHGEWKFKSSLIKNHFFKEITFSPVINFEPNTLYLVKIGNIKGFGLNEANSYQLTFKTQGLTKALPSEDEEREEESFPEPERTKPEIAEREGAEAAPIVKMLRIPLDWQDSPLSCEAASLKMALTGKGVFVSEDEIMEKIGYDLSPRKGDVWSDPYELYVGDVDGKICKTGYGVYWQPVAQAASYWREAQAFSDWTLKGVITEIELGNPVILWGVTPIGTLTDCSWYTPEGKYIKAFREMHARLGIGFVGPPENPSKIILNDPWVGRIYWETSYFLKNWAVFNHSGVTIR